MLHAKKMMTRLLAAFAAVSILLLCCSCGTQPNPSENAGTASIADAQPSEGLTFLSHNDGTCAVSGIGSCKDTQLVVPKKSPAGDLVTDVANAAFYGCGQIEAVVFPDSVTVIAESAFRGCSNLKRASFPADIAYIESYAFSGTALTDVTLDGQISELGMGVFQDCTSLSSVVLSSAFLLNLPDHLFAGCSQLRQIQIPAAVSEIQSSAFEACAALTAVQLPEQLVVIGARAFASCQSLSSIVIPAGVTTIADGAFCGNTALRELTLYSSVTVIAADAFLSCPNLLTVHYYGTLSQWQTLCTSCSLSTLDAAQVNCTDGVPAETAAAQPAATDAPAQTAPAVTEPPAPATQPPQTAAQADFSERYSYFLDFSDGNSVQVSVSELYECMPGQRQKLQLRHVYADQNGSTQDQPLQGAVITIDDQLTNYVTDANGMVEIDPNALWDMLPEKPQSDIVTVGFTCSSEYFVPTYFECCYWDWSERLSGNPG